MATYTLFPSILPARREDGEADTEYRLTRDDILGMDWNDVQRLRTHFPDCEANTREGIADELAGEPVPSYTFADD